MDDYRELLPRVCIPRANILHGVSQPRAVASDGARTVGVTLCDFDVGVVGPGDSTSNHAEPWRRCRPFQLEVLGVLLVRPLQCNQQFSIARDETVILLTSPLHSY